MSSDEFDRLKLQNVVLKAELARLQALKIERDGENDNDDEKQKTNVNKINRVQNKMMIKQVFDLYDVDNSGYIDRNELANAAMMLNEVLDENELEQAFNELDINKDNRISLDEFQKWFLSPNRTVTDKTLMKIAAIKTKLMASTMFSENDLPKLLRRLSEHEPTDTPEIKHSLSYSLGDVTNPKASLKIMPKFEKTQAKVFDYFPQSKASFTLKFRVHPNTDREKSRINILDALKKNAAPKPINVRILIDDPEYTEICVGSPVNVTDPFESIMDNVDIGDFIHDTFFQLKLGHALNDLLNTENPPSGSLVEHVAFALEMQIHFRKALLSTLVESANTPAKWAKLGGLLAFSWLEESEIHIKLGGMDKFAQGMKDYMQSGNLVQMLEHSHQVSLRQFEQLHADAAMIEVLRRQQQLELEALKAKEEGGELPFYMNLNWYTNPNGGYQYELRNQYHGLWEVMIKTLPPTMTPLVMYVQEYFSEFVGAAFCTKSAVGIELICDQFFPLSLLPKFKVDPNSQKLKL